MHKVSTDLRGGKRSKEKRTSAIQWHRSIVLCVEMEERGLKITKNQQSFGYALYAWLLTNITPIKTQDNTHKHTHPSPTQYKCIVNGFLFIWKYVSADDNERYKCKKKIKVIEIY